MDDKGWPSRNPMLAQVRAAIRRHKRIDVDVLTEAARNKAELKVILGGLNHLKRDHPKRWQDHKLSGSLLKRLRNQQVATT